MFLPTKAYSERFDLPVTVVRDLFKSHGISPIDDHYDELQGVEILRKFKRCKKRIKRRRMKCYLKERRLGV